MAWTIVAEQGAVVAIGMVGALVPPLSDAALRAFAVAQLMLLSALVVCLIASGAYRHPRPRVAVWAIAGLVVALIPKLAFSELNGIDRALGGLRLTLPLVAVLGLVQFPALTRVLQTLLSERTRFLWFSLAATLGTLLLTRSSGWAGAWLSGNTVLPLLAVVVVSRGGQIHWPLGFTCLATSLLAYKRWAVLVNATMLIGLLILEHRPRPSILLKCAAVAAALGYLLLLAPATEPVRARFVSSYETVFAGSGRDDSFVDISTRQRLFELRSLADVAARDAIAPLWGAAPTAIHLPGGRTTTAIHNTPAFVFFHGGILLVIAFVSLVTTRHRLQAPKGTLTRIRWIFLAAALGVVDSIAGNAALSPAFAVSLATLLGSKSGGQY